MAHLLISPAGLRAVTRVARMAVLRSMGCSDYKRWSNPDNLEMWWESRTQKLAGMIPRGTRVLEFGAGRRRLAAYLDSTCTYIPSDLVAREPDTLVCDLNRRPFPDLGPLAPEVAVFAGVLEYVRDVPAMIEWLSAHVRYCVASYAFVKESGLVSTLVRGATRTYYGYMNAYGEVELQALFMRSGFTCLRTDSWNDQRLFLFEKKQVEARR